MYKRKLDGVVVESPQWTNKFVNPTQLYIFCEKSGGLHLVEAVLTTSRQADEIQVTFKIFKACCRSKYLIFHFV